MTLAPGTYNWAPYQAASGCTKYGPAGAEALMVYLEDWFPGQTSFGICNCREIRGGSSWSHHAECRAYDEGFVVFTGQTIGIQTLWLLGPHGARLGIDHMIMNHKPGASDRGDPRIYSARSPQGRTYTGAHPHKNHNHIGLTRAAGRNLTYATLVAVVGAPNPGQGEQMLDSRTPSPSEAVADFQRSLIEIGYDLGDFSPFAAGYPPGADGFWGDTTAGVTKQFQAEFGLTQSAVGDGVTVATVHDFAVRARSGGQTPDLSHLATKDELATHAQSRASATTHPHKHDEGETGGPK